MFYDEYELTYWVVFSTLMHLSAFTFVCIHALRRRRNASATLLWIFIAWSFPIVGPLIYIGFGIDRVSDKGRLKKIANELLHRQHSEQHREYCTFTAWHLNHRIPSKNVTSSLFRKLNTAIDRIHSDQHLVRGNHFELLQCGDEAYPQMLKAIRSAQNHIHFECFIIQPDDTSHEFMELLKQKAESGVKVRLLFDRFGSTYAYLGGFFRKYKHIPNFHLIGWTQANPLKRQFQINLRNHRKTLIIDGETAFFGGINLSKENRMSKDKPAIRDYHFRAEGPIVHELQLSFLRDWHFMTNTSTKELLDQQLFPQVNPCGEAYARIIDSGPDHPDLISEVLFNSIVLARKKILLTTPYFVPPPDLLKALRSAALRGVDVRLLIPEKNNHRYAGLASKALYEELLTSGVRIFERKPPFLHAKSLVIDSELALVGTVNFDVRSIELNYETSALIADNELIRELNSVFAEEIKNSTEILLPEWNKRSTDQRLAENLCSLMSPVL